MAHVDIGAPLTGKLPSKTMLSSNKTHSTHTPTDIKVKMSTSTILIVGTVPSSIVRGPPTPVHVTTESTPTLPESALRTLGGRRTSPQIPPIVGETPSQLTFSKTDTLGSPTNEGTTF